MMTMSWHMMINFEPPILGCVDQQPKPHVQHREGDQTMRDQHSHQGAGKQGGQLRKHLEAEGRRVQDLSADTDAALHVKAPLMAECYANLECKVVDARMANSTLLHLEVLKAWIDLSKKQPRTIHHLGKGVFMVAGRTIRLASKRSSPEGAWFTKSFRRALPWAGGTAGPLAHMTRSRRVRATHHPGKLVVRFTHPTKYPR